MKNNILILGFGSNILTDAGIGLHLVNDIQSSGLIINTDFNTALISSLDVLDLIIGYKTLIIIDGIKSGNDPLGEVKEFSLANFSPTLHLTNVHDFEFRQIIELGKLLHLKMPRYIRIISIEIKDNLTFSNNISSELTSKYSYIKSKVINQIEDIIRVVSVVNQ